MNEKEQYIAAVLWELHETKQLNRELLRKNTNLTITIENAKLKVRLEWYQAFAERKRGNRNDNQC